MKYTTWLLTICLIIGYLLGECRTKAIEENDDSYPADDYVYDDDDDDEDVKIENGDQGSNTMFSNITHPPPYFEQSELEIHANPGDNVLINCDVRNFQISNVVMWYKNTTTIINGQYAINNRVESMKNNSILIKNVWAEDAGDYYCEVLPERIRMHASVKVGGRLSIYCDGRDVTDRSITFRQGEKHTFDCKTYLPTSPDIKWFFNGQRIDSHHNLSIVTSGNQINLLNIDEYYSGNYQCLADDGSKDPPHGMVTIDVPYSPKVSTHRHHVNAKIGSSADLYCDYKANPIAISMWLYNGRTLQNSDKYSIRNSVHNVHNRTTLRITDVISDDVGDYICQVENVFGSNSTRVQLVFVPETPQFENMNIDGNKVTLHWLVRSLQPLSEAILDYRLLGSYTWSSVTVIRTERHADNSGMWKITHEMELVPGVWHTRVKTKNTVGWGHFSPMHEFIIKEENDDDEEVKNSYPPGDLVMAGIGFGNNKNNTGIRLPTVLPSLFAVSLMMIHL